MSLLYIPIDKKSDGTFNVSWTNGPVVLDSSNVVVKLTTEVLTNITKITSVTENTKGEIVDKVYLKKLFKYENGNGWSELLPLETITGITFEKCNPLILELYYYFTLDDGRYKNTQITLDNILIKGEYQQDIVEDSQGVLNNTNDELILSPTDVYKIFSLDGFKVFSNHDGYDIKYRFTQDDGKTFSKWEPLTTENISKIRLNMLRFAKVQYLVKNISDQPLAIYDIILSGNFQNVSANYLKTNRYGLKEDCLTRLQNMTGVAGSDKIHQNFYTACLSSYNQNTDITTDLANQNAENSGKLWNPYQSDKIS